jgi:ectoine hydroxylase-related dioxygenase (phytanoyl-CoA dioxygenase family)
VASVIALEDFRAENGATRVAPGSHRWPPAREAHPHEMADAVMPAGAAGDLPRLDDPRRGRQHHCGSPPARHARLVRARLAAHRENQYLSVPADVVRELPRRAQELLGWAAHDAIAAGGGYLGTVDLRDPVDLLAEGRL